MLTNIVKRIFNKNNLNDNSIKVKKRVSGKLFFNDEMQKWIINNNRQFYNNYSYFENNCCPACGTVFDSIVTSSKKCPECKCKIILRTNKESSKKLLLTENEAKKYDKDDEIRKDILFYEKQIKALNNMYSQYMYYFWNLKKEKPEMSARDYAWSFENWLYNTLDIETVKEYQKHLKLNFQDKVLKCDWDIIILQRSSNVYRYMIDIALYKSKYDVAEEMMLSLMYRSVTLAHLPYYHWKERPFSKIQFYSDASFGMNYVKDYLQKNQIPFKALKEKFFQRAHPFLLNILSKEDAWNTLCETYNWYINTLNNN